MPLPGTRDPDLSDRLVVAIAREYQTGSFAPWHAHRRGQLIFVVSGALRIETDDGLYLAPPSRAAWISGGVPHSVAYTEKSSVCVAYARPGCGRPASESCSVFALTGLMRELVLRAVEIGWGYSAGGAEERTMQVLIDELSSLRSLGVFLPYGRDPRLRRILDALKEDPGSERQLDDWAAEVGASSRTLARLFRDETGLSFRAWREQLRVARSVEMLAAGRSVTQIAYDLGYSSSANFTTMFTRAMSVSPRAYLSPLSTEERQ